MVQSFATAILFLFAATLVAAHSRGPTSRAVDHGRRAKLIEYNFEECPQVPTLHCRNRSYCTPGAASFGKSHDHLDLQTQEKGYFCVCQPGFIGHECEIEVDECEGAAAADPSSCYYGSKCRTSGDGFACDCKKLNEGSGPTDTKYAGSSCQHESTSMCAVSLAGTHASNHQFCTNHGECFKMVTGGEPHPGCVCNDGWTGNHCEIRRDPFAVARSQESEEKKRRDPHLALWSVMVIPTVLGALLAYKIDGVITQQRAREKEAKEAEGIVFQGQTGQTHLANGDLDPDGSGTLGNGAESEDEPLGSPTSDVDGGLDDYEPETKIV
eukprot:CAMPEP_0172533230 /NCGR_PEP_ID=MMETSP1067-20121228/6009_1 /TAXON_ID=265564 ORGANISM="Thalassiosira punctigera, Strain Tpunct2005C2" /NCGR_SAMPLE_ID=MMETSP1067 /ASSEMBLY_ACC=CAM_ASM_000444 /LENGTH=324 /DNA_ID=CAMNT_0013317851 /DNA_START=54 /DNA_END=1028 /DNA_ORIENTATION=-